MEGTVIRVCELCGASGYEVDPQGTNEEPVIVDDICGICEATN